MSYSTYPSLQSTTSRQAQPTFGRHTTQAPPSAGYEYDSQGYVSSNGISGTRAHSSTTYGTAQASSQPSRQGRGPGERQQSYDPIAFERLIGLQSDHLSPGGQVASHSSSLLAQGYTAPTQTTGLYSSNANQLPQPTLQTHRSQQAQARPQRLPPNNDNAINRLTTQPIASSSRPPANASQSTVQNGSGRTTTLLRPWEDAAPALTPQAKPSTESTQSGPSSSSTSIQTQTQARARAQAQAEAITQARLRQRDIGGSHGDSWEARAASESSASGSTSGSREVLKASMAGRTGTQIQAGGRGNASRTTQASTPERTTAAQSQLAGEEQSQRQAEAQAQRQAQNSRYAGQMALVPVDMGSELTGGSGRTGIAGSQAQGRQAATAAAAPASIGARAPAGEKGKAAAMSGNNGTGPTKTTTKAMSGNTSMVAATLGANMASTPVRPGQAPVGRQVPRSATEDSTTASGSVVPAALPSISSASATNMAEPMDVEADAASSPTARGRGRDRGRGGVTGRGRGGAAAGRGGNAIGAAARGRGAFRGRGIPPGRVGVATGPPLPPKPLLRTLFQHAQAYVEKDNTVEVSPSAEVNVDALIARQKQLIEEAAREEERRRIAEEARLAAVGGSDGGDDMGPGGFDLAGGSEIDFSDSDFDVDFESDDSDYERSRQRRIEQNRQMMEQLGLGGANDYRLPDSKPIRKRRGRLPGAKDIKQRKFRGKHRPAEYDEDGTTFDYCDKGERQRLAYVEIKPVFRSERIASTYTFLELPPVPENPREPDPSDDDLPANDDWWWVEPMEEQKPERKKRGPQAHREKPSDAPGEMCHQCRRRSYKPMMLCTNEDPHCRRRYCLTCVDVRYNFLFDDNDTNWLCPKCVGNCNCSACLRQTGLLSLLKEQIPTEEGKRMNFKAITKNTNFQRWLEQLGAPKVLPKEDEKINAIRFIMQEEDIVSPDIPDDVYDEIMYPHKKRPMPVEGETPEEQPTQTSKRKRGRKSLANGNGLMDPELDGAETEGPSKRRRKRPVELDEDGNPIKKRRGRPPGSKVAARPLYDESGVYQGELDVYGNPVEVDELQGYADAFGEPEGDEFERTYGYHHPPEPQPNSAGYVFGGADAQLAVPETGGDFAEPIETARPKPKPRKRKLTKKQQAEADAEAETQAEAATAIAAAQLQQLGQQLGAAPSDSELSTPPVLEKSESEDEDDYLMEASDVQVYHSRYPTNVFGGSPTARPTPAQERSARHYTPITVEESVRYAQQKRKEADAILARQGSGSGYGSGYGY